MKKVQERLLHSYWWWFGYTVFILLVFSLFSIIFYKDRSLPVFSCLVKSTSARLEFDVHNIIVYLVIRLLNYCRVSYLVILLKHYLLSTVGRISTKHCETRKCNKFLIYDFSWGKPWLNHKIQTVETTAEQTWWKSFWILYHYLLGMTPYYRIPWKIVY